MLSGKVAAKAAEEEERNHKISMIVPGTVLEGTVETLMPYGAFISLGDGLSGLVHISQICDRYIKHPLEALSVGDVVEVKVLEVDLQKKRIALTMKGI